MGKRFNRLLYYTVFAAWLSVPMAAVAQDGETGSVPLIRGTLVRHAARITFEWPEPVPFTADVKGSTLTIRFEREAHPDFGGLLSQLYPYIVSAEQTAGGYAIVLTLDKPYRIRSFTSGEVGGVELIGVDPGERREAKGEGTE
ncbi:MAG: hypothetical protein KGJ06_03765, partial [Pseudomonadota bacterium]|nr:hypothetical protein [Pseudomonadota bacterium]